MTTETGADARPPKRDWRKVLEAIPEVHKQTLTTEVVRILEAAASADDAKATAIGQARALVAEARQAGMSDTLIEALDDLVKSAEE